MKHPILYRTAMYTIILGLCGCIVALTSMINEAPFKSSDMRAAYYHGCNLGMHKGGVFNPPACEIHAEVFKETLDDLDKQLEK